MQLPRKISHNDKARVVFPILDSEGMKQLADEMETRIEMIFDELDDHPCCAYNRNDDEFYCDTHKSIVKIRKIIKFLRGE